MSTQREKDERKIMLEALYQILNIEGCAMDGAYPQMDVKHHFDVVRRAISLVDPEGKHMVTPDDLPLFGDNSQMDLADRKDVR